MDFFDSLHNASLFCPRSGLKSCRCAAQTPADTGFLQAFDPTRGAGAPSYSPLQKRTLFLQTGFFDSLETARKGGLFPFRWALWAENVQTAHGKGGERPEILRFWNSLRAEISDLHLTFGEKSYKMFICP
ncbi:hypothetical protein [Dysosmobacter sp. HCP28S3_G4]|uniref:hypothetical protein n=1 Tax=Dysosmobacter sp. HCP28S3_G4 TaxID=3438938 RepID=UPI003F8B505D